jgi:FkbM family methyltransferase
MPIGNFIWFATNHPVGRHDPLGTGLRIAHWQMLSRLKSGPQVRPWFDDLRLNVSRGMTSATGNIYYGLHEFNPMAFVAHYVRPDDLFVDIGANVGTYSLLAAAHCSARVIAIEASPATAACLAGNVALNSLSERIEVHRCAAGLSAGNIAMTVKQGAANHVVIGDNAAGEGVETVVMSTIDLIVDGRQPSMMKLDVEGFENEVIAGAIETLGAASLDAIQIESVDDDLNHQLGKFGFRRHWYDGSKRELLDAPRGKLPGDAIYLRNLERVRERLASARTLNIRGLAL